MKGILLFILFYFILHFFYFGFYNHHFVMRFIEWENVLFLDTHKQYFFEFTDFRYYFLRIVI